MHGLSLQANRLAGIVHPTQTVNVLARIRDATCKKWTRKRSGLFARRCWLHLTQAAPARA
jgi:hypothetical protein